MNKRENQIPKTIHVGNLIRKLFDKRRIRKAALSRKIGKNSGAIEYYLKSESIKSSNLLMLSNALSHNFFQDIASLLPADYDTENDIFEDKNKEIAELKHQIELLERENETLLKVIRK